MNTFLIPGERSQKFPLLFILFILAACLALSPAAYSLTAISPALVEDSITGTVHNQTTGQPSAGDDVVLLRLVGSMPEETRTKTDDQGVFHLSVKAGDEGHVVRVLHQGVNYDQMVTGAAPLDIRVFDALAKADNVEGTLGMMRL